MSAQNSRQNQEHFADHKDQQRIADELKAIIRDDPGDSPAAQRFRRLGMNRLIRFEYGEWRPQDFQAAVENVTHGNLHFDPGQPGHLLYNGIDPTQAIYEVLGAYNDLIDPPRPGKLYSTFLAAVYLDLSEVAVKKHIHQTGLLRGQKLGHDLVFTQEELDAFNALDRKVGRPRQASSNGKPSRR